MKRVFLDSSILVAGLIDFGAPSGNPIAVMDWVAAAPPAGVHTAWHCCLEFYSVVTRLPAEYRLTPDIALRLLETEVFARMRIGAVPAASMKSFFRAVAADRIRGGRIYDAHIGAVAVQEGADVLVTENTRHFDALERGGIRVLDATQFVGLIG